VIAFLDDEQGHRPGALQAAREHLRSGRQTLSGFHHRRRNGKPDGRVGNFGVGPAVHVIHAQRRRVVVAHRHRHDVRLQGKKRNPLLGHAARHLAEGIIAPAVVAQHVALEALPIEPAFEQHVLALGREGDHRGVQILFVIEIALAHEVLVLRILAHLGAVEQFQNARGPQARDVDVQHHRIVRRQAFEHGGGSQGARTIPDHAPERHSAKRRNQQDQQPRAGFRGHESSITQPRVRWRALPSKAGYRASTRSSCARNRAG